MKKTLTMLALLVSTALVFSGVLTSCSDDEDDVLANEEEITPPDDEGTTDDDVTADDDEGTTPDDGTADDGDEPGDEHGDEPEDEPEEETLEPLYIPLPFAPIDNTKKGAPTGEPGDFYYTYEELSGTDTGRANTEEMFQLSYTDWVAFLTTGVLKSKLGEEYVENTYDLKYDSEDAFWECYDGKDSNNRDYGGISDEIFYVNPDDSLVQLKASQTAYAGYGSTWNTGGVNWNLRAFGGAEDYLDSHFWMGAHLHFVATSGTNMKINGSDYSFDNVPTYDDDGKKFYVSLTFNSKDPYTNPDIVLYTYIHVTEKAE